MQNIRLKKNVGVIHHITLGKPLGLIAKKLFNVLLFKAHRRLLNQERHQVAVKEITELLGFNSHNTEALKDALRDLVDARIEWNALGDAGETEWAVTSALAEAKIANGVCTYAYAPTLRDKLANPEVWALIDLKLQRRFTRSHTWSLYENVARYRGVGLTRQFDLKLLTGLLGLSDSKAYQEFKYLNRDVINPALKEINSKSDIEVAMLPPRRMRRKVVAVQFEVKEKRTEEETGLRNAALARLEHFNVKGRDAQIALQMHSDEKLMAILNEIEKRWKAGGIDNIRAYTVTVLRDFEGDIVPPLELNRESKRRERERRAQKDELFRKRQHEEALEQRRREEELVLQVERGLSEAEAQALEAAFVETLTAEGDFVYDQFRAKGLASRLVRERLHQFKVERMLGRDRVVVDGDEAGAITRTAS